MVTVLRVTMANRQGSRFLGDRIDVMPAMREIFADLEEYAKAIHSGHAPGLLQMLTVTATLVTYFWSIGKNI